MTANPYLFQGRRFDGESALYYFRNRMYDPQHGRFLSRDPMGYADSYCLYQFVNNNPICYTDPEGRMMVGFLGEEQGESGVLKSRNTEGHAVVGADMQFEVSIEGRGSIVNRYFLQEVMVYSAQAWKIRDCMLGEVTDCTDRWYLDGGKRYPDLRSIRPNSLQELATNDIPNIRSRINASDSGFAIYEGLFKMWYMKSAAFKGRDPIVNPKKDTAMGMIAWYVRLSMTWENSKVTARSHDLIIVYPTFVWGKGKASEGQLPKGISPNFSAPTAQGVKGKFFGRNERFDFWMAVLKAKQNINDNFSKLLNLQPRGN